MESEGFDDGAATTKGDLATGQQADTGREAVENELRRVLESDATRLGDVYRRADLTAAEVAAELGVASLGFVYSYRATIDSILTGRVGVGPTMASQIAGRLRVWLRRRDWTSGARDHLEVTLTGLEAVANDADQREAEDASVAARTEEVERSGEPGIYVYSLLHYLRHPYDGDTGHTLFKVGRSEVDVFGRLANQSRTTALPEDPVLLRVYSAAGVSYSDEENVFHRGLMAADHQRSRGSKSGREWFLTSLAFLDWIADTRNLSTTFRNVDGLGEG